MALFLYRLILLIFLPLIILLTLIRSINRPAYRQRLSERLGFTSTQFNREGIMIHGASVGEVQALKPFIEKSLLEFSNTPITVTTFTPTGSAQVKKLFGDRVQHSYLPLDIWPCTYLFLKRLSPKTIVVMETELWPCLAAQANKNQIKQLLINGRISDQTFSYYQQFSSLVSQCLKNFNHIQTQSKVHAQRFIALGARPETCITTGNLKFDITVTAETKQKQCDIATLLPDDRPTMLIASTHNGDEVLAINAFNRILEKYKNALLLIVPRHPERFNKVAQLIAANHLIYQRRSENSPILPNTQVLLIDTLGELMAVIPFANVVIMGGTFSTIGGHNPLEPALYKKPIIAGSDMANFKEIHQLLVQENAIVTINSKEDIAEQIADSTFQLITNPILANEIGEKAYQVVKQNQGATDIAINKLKALYQLK